MRLIGYVQDPDGRKSKTGSWKMGQWQERANEIHFQFAKNMEAMGGIYHGPRAYLGGDNVTLGTPFASIPDGIVGTAKAPAYAIELKTHFAVMRQAQADSYQKNLPPGTIIYVFHEFDWD